MVGFTVLAALFIVFAPIIISIVAMVKVSALRNELARLKHTINRQAVQNAPAPQAEPDRRPEPPEQEAVKPEPAPIPAKPPVPPAAPPRSVPAPTPGHGVEFLMGGRAAAFIGIAILVIGIALLVGYAIQNAWLGPGARVLLGLVSGLVLVGLGHGVSRLDEKFAVFARVLTGGGSALFYFTVFASFAFYHLIGALMAGVGLFICAAAVFGLSMLYGSQVVAVLGVLGAFVTPLLIGGNLETGVFPLVYIAVINVPVILLGVRRKWQWLYNAAFFFTVIHSLIWMDRLNDSDFIPGLIFFIVLYLQFAGLGLLKLRHEQNINGRMVDFIRLSLLSMFLLGMVYWLFTETGKNGCGLAFALIGLMQFGIAFLSHKILARFSGETTAFVAGGSFALVMALPVQFDGEWVSLGWGIQGAVLAWFSLRVKSRVLQGGAFFLGLVGVLKVLVFDVEQYIHPPTLFLNARFAVGLISAVLLAVQGLFAARLTDENEPDIWVDLGWIFGSVSILLFFLTDIFWTIGTDNPGSWLLSSAVFLAAGTFLLLFAPKRPSILWMGGLLLTVMPVKLLLVDSLLAAENFKFEAEPFANGIIGFQFILLLVHLALVQPALRKVKFDTAAAFPVVMNMASLAAVLGLGSLELARFETDWADTGITIFWAVSALALILFGMKRRTAPHRYLGLILFGITTLKVLLVDSSELEGLQRIGAFIGTGLMLLILAFAYQKASAFFQSLDDEK